MDLTAEQAIMQAVDAPPLAGPSSISAQPAPSRRNYHRKKKVDWHKTCLLIYTERVDRKLKGPHRILWRMSRECKYIVDSSTLMGS